MCSWAAVYGNGLCSKTTEQTNNTAIEVTKHCLELGTPERSSGTVCKTSQSKPSGNDPLQNSFLWRSAHTSVREELACCRRLTSHPEWSTLFLSSIRHPFEPSAFPLGLELCWKTQASYITFGSLTYQKRLRGFFLFALAAIFLFLQEYDWQGAMFSVLSRSFRRPTLPHRPPKAIFLLHCLYLVPMELRGIQTPASLQGAFWSLLQQLAYMSLKGKACIHVAAHLKRRSSWQSKQRPKDVEYLTALLETVKEKPCAADGSIING